MKWFGRNSSENEAVPEDLQQYYNSDKTSPLKWVVRIVIFLLVLALLIWGGLWLFSKLTHKSSNVAKQTSSSTSQKASQQSKQAEEAQKKALADKAVADAAAKKAADDAKQKDQEAQAKAAEAVKAEADAQKAHDAQVAQENAQKQTAAASGALPSTGPSSSVMVVIFATVSIVGAVMHAVFTRRRLV